MIIWPLLSLVHQPVTGLLQYSAAELLRLHLHLSAPRPAVLHLHPDIAFPPHRGCIHRGSCRSFQVDTSKTINSIWSNFRRLPRNTGQVVDHSVLARPAQSTNTAVRCNNAAVNFGLLNIRSLTSKGHLIQDLLIDRKFDFLCLTETWQQPNDFSQLNESAPPGFVYICQPRGSGRGGGLVIIHCEKWKVLPVSAPTFSSFESTVCQLSGPTPTIIATVYCPLKPNSDFLNGFADFLTHLTTLLPNIILLGDFNIHTDNLNNLLTRDFTSCLDSLGRTVFGLQQHANVPTHLKGHILDLICCSGVAPLHITADDLPISDHFLLSFTVKPPLSITKLPRLISFHSIKNINLDSLSFSTDSLMATLNLSTPEELVSQYNAGLHSILNSLAPLKTRSVSFSHSAPWFTPELRVMKAKGRQLEWLHKKTGLTVHKQIYNDNILHYKDCITQTKSNFYSSIIRSNEGNTKALFSLFKNIIQPPDSLPSHLHSADLCNSLMSFFNEKIQKIHQHLGSKPPPNILPEPPLLTSSFSSFLLPSNSEISDLICKSKPSTCQLDPLPTALVKAFLPSLLPLISAIIHSFLSSGTVPAPFKTAAITSVLKKPSADPTNFHNLHPISNLPFISKILKKTVRFSTSYTFIPQHHV